MPDVRTTRAYYHRTNRHAAEAIMQEGFRDVSETLETGSTARGTWFTNSLASGASVPVALGDVVVAVELPVDVAEQYFHTEDQNYREYLIPAAILNSYPRRLLQGDVGCAGPSRRFPVGELDRCSGIASPTGDGASHPVAGTESCVQSGNGLDEA